MTEGRGAHWEFVRTGSQAPDPSPESDANGLGSSTSGWTVLGATARAVGVGVLWGAAHLQESGSGNRPAPRVLVLFVHAAN